MLWTERVTLREKCPYSEFFWSLLSRIRREYVEIPLISLYSVPMRENKDQKNSQNLHFSRSYLIFILACFSSINRKIKNQFPLFIFTNVSLRVPSWNLKNNDLFRNHQIFLRRASQIALTWFLPESLLKKGCESDFALRKRKPWCLTITHRSRNLRKAPEKCFRFYWNCKQPWIEWGTVSNCEICFLIYIWDYASNFKTIFTIWF